MGIKTIQSGNQAIESQAAKEGDNIERRSRRDSKLIDVAHEAMTNKAAEDRATLEALIKMGWPHVERERFKKKIRQKVWDVVKTDSVFDDSEIVEEITERLVDAAEVDQYYKSLFDKKERA